MAADDPFALALQAVRDLQSASKKPLAIILSGHNGSGKSTFWYRRLANDLKIPLVNADRLMLSVLPERTKSGRLPRWAEKLRDSDQAWMRVAQGGVMAFVQTAMFAKVPFAIETVFSHWKKRADGRIESKIDLIKDLKKAGYFVLLIFVGLASAELSILRVQTRKAEGGHDVPNRIASAPPEIAVWLDVVDKDSRVDRGRR